MTIIPEAEETLQGVSLVGDKLFASYLKDARTVVKVYDRDGQLVGTKTEKDHALVLLPNSEHAFQVSSSAELPSGSYATQKVFVRDARDARRWP